MDSVSPQTQNIHSFRKRLMFHVIMFEIKLFRVIWLFCCSKSFFSALYYIELPYNIKIHLVNIPTSQMYSPIIKKVNYFELIFDVKQYRKLYHIFIGISFWSMKDTFNVHGVKIKYSVNVSYHTYATQQQELNWTFENTQNSQYMVALLVKLHRMSLNYNCIYNKREGH